MSTGTLLLLSGLNKGLPVLSSAWSVQALGASQSLLQKRRGRPPGGGALPSKKFFSWL
jgi:hypothetical protein